MFFIPPINRWADPTGGQKKEAPTLADMVKEAMDNPKPIKPGSLADMLQKEMGRRFPDLFGDRTKEVFVIDELTFAELERNRAGRGMVSLTQESGVMGLVEAFRGLAQNILGTEGVGDKAKAIEALAGEFTARITEALKAGDRMTKDKKPAWQWLETPEGDNSWIASREASTRPDKSKRYH